MGRCPLEPSRKTGGTAGSGGLTTTPHPNPLPIAWGEGTIQVPQRLAITPSPCPFDAAGRGEDAPAAPSVFPLPPRCGGEVWGEGRWRRHRRIRPPRGSPPWRENSDPPCWRPATTARVGLAKEQAGVNLRRWNHPLPAFLCLFRAGFTDAAMRTAAGRPGCRALTPHQRAPAEGQ